MNYDKAARPSQLQTSEPVAWISEHGLMMLKDSRGNPLAQTAHTKRDVYTVPLYALPSPRVAPTSDERQKLKDWLLKCNNGGSPVCGDALNEIERLERELARISSIAPNTELEPRFFIDHGMIHDRITGRHVHGNDELEPGIADEAILILNDMWFATLREIKRSTASSHTAAPSVRQINEQLWPNGNPADAAPSSTAPFDQAALDAASREVHMMLLREGSSWGTKACEEMGRVFMVAYQKALSATGATKP